MMEAEENRSLLSLDAARKGRAARRGTHGAKLSRKQQRVRRRKQRRKQRLNKRSKRRAQRAKKLKQRAKRRAKRAASRAARKAANLAKRLALQRESQDEIARKRRAKKAEREADIKAEKTPITLLPNRGPVGSIESVTKYKSKFVVDPEDPTKVKRVRIAEKVRVKNIEQKIRVRDVEDPHNWVNIYVPRQVEIPDPLAAYREKLDLLKEQVKFLRKHRGELREDLARLRLRKRDWQVVEDGAPAPMFDDERKFFNALYNELKNAQLKPARNIKQVDMDRAAGVIPVVDALRVKVDNIVHASLDQPLVPTHAWGNTL